MDTAEEDSTATQVAGWQPERGEKDVRWGKTHFLGALADPRLDFTMSGRGRESTMKVPAQQSQAGEVQDGRQEAALAMGPVLT